MPKRRKHRRAREIFQCAWAGCEATFEGETPESWTDLIAVSDDIWLDVALCPKHRKQLVARLIEFGLGQAVFSGANAA
jgi:hypothetical protein